MSARCVMGHHCDLRDSAVPWFSTGWLTTRRPAARITQPRSWKKREEVKPSDREGSNGVVRSGCRHALPQHTVSVALNLSWHASRLRRWQILLAELAFNKTPFRKYTEPPPYLPVKLEFLPSKFKMRRNHLFGSILAALCWLLSCQTGTHFYLS